MAPTYGPYCEGDFWHTGYAGYVPVSCTEPVYFRLVTSNILACGDLEENGAGSLFAEAVNCGDYDPEVEALEWDTCACIPQSH
jgi:hypothetical protein